MLHIYVVIHQFLKNSKCLDIQHVIQTAEEAEVLHVDILNKVHNFSDTNDDLRYVKLKDLVL